MPPMVSLETESLKLKHNLGESERSELIFAQRLEATFEAVSITHPSVQLSCLQLRCIVGNK